MKTIYLAIWYACNQKCIGCPCTLHVDKSKNMTFETIKDFFDKIKDSNEPINVTISGGEPTLHPDFIKIIRYFCNNDIGVTLLTNAEKFADENFCNEFLNNCNILNTRVITTIHSSSYEIHEKQNNSIGSFMKSIKGLKYLFHRGIGITIKHCITKENYKDTLQFVRMVDSEFHPSVDIQFFGLDYCGLTKERAKDLYCDFREMQEDIEKALDLCMEIYSRNGRQTNLFNIPLCWIDPYYWKLCCLNDVKSGYEMYLDPTVKLQDFNDGAGKYAKQCKNCYVYEICPGTYKSLFDYFGEGAVSRVYEYKN